jgi:hypothetical protein
VADVEDLDDVALDCEENTVAVVEKLPDFAIKNSLSTARAHRWGNSWRVAMASKTPLNQRAALRGAI